MSSIDEDIVEIGELLGENKHLIHQLIDKIRLRPKATATWKAKREKEEFLVKGRNIFDFTITGWDNLLAFTKMKETTCRQYFSKGDGVLQLTLDDDDKIPQIYTITRI